MPVKAFSQYLGKSGTWPAIVVFAIALAITQQRIYSFEPRLNESESVLDLRMKGWTGEDAKKYFDLLQQQGILDKYEQIFTKAYDIVYPAALLFLSTAVISKLYPGSLLNLLPLGTFVSDMVENFFILQTIEAYRRNDLPLMDYLATYGTAFTIAKFAFFVPSILLISFAICKRLLSPNVTKNVTQKKKSK